MIPISENIVKKAISKYKIEINKYIEERRGEIEKTKHKYRKNTEERIYFDKLYKDIDKILFIKPDEFKKIKRKYGVISISKKRNLSTPEKAEKERKKKFRDEVLKVLDYTSLRSKFYPKYFKEIGIKTCVYCNSQFTISTEEKAKFQIDHYVSKDKYPCLSISFYNLYPSCASCNNSKSNKKIEFKLYTNKISETKKSEFEFILDKSCEAKFLTNRDIDVIKFEFTEPDINKPFQKTFDIQGIYDTQKDIVEELIIKKQMYNDAYKQTLKDSFPNLFNNSTSLSNRIVIGNYSFADEIHKRPMSKFTQDIARQLELIE